MSRIFQTPKNQARKRKIITVTMLVLLSLSLITYQLIKKEKLFTNQKETIDFANATESLNNQKIEYENNKDDVTKLKIEIENLQRIVNDHRSRIEELEKKNRTQGRNVIEENLNEVEGNQGESSN